MIFKKKSILINNMHVDLYKLIESYTDNYIYYYIVKNNKKNIYIKNMKLQILKFYNQYNINGNYIKSEYVKRLEINDRGKIRVDEDKYITPNEYFDIYI